MSKSVMSERLKWLRKSKGLNQEELGNLIGVTKQRISQTESGRHSLSIEVLIKLCDFYECSIDYVLGRTDAPTKIVGNSVSTHIQIESCKYQLKTKSEIANLMRDMRKVMKKYELNMEENV